MEKTEIDLLIQKVQEANEKVAQLQAKVASISQKSSKFNELLAEAKNRKASALSYKNILDEVLEQALTTKNNSLTASIQTAKANEMSKAVANDLQLLLDKLTYAVETVQKMAQRIEHKKAINPLIPDELLDLSKSIISDANSTVALCLTALKSAFESQSSNILANKTLGISSQQAATLYQSLSQSKEDSKCIKDLVYDAYEKVVSDYNSLSIANDQINIQLQKTENDLNAAEINLQSLQAGLSAAETAQTGNNSE